MPAVLADRGEEVVGVLAVEGGAAGDDPLLLIPGAAASVRSGDHAAVVD